LEHGPIAFFVPDVVPAEDGPTLELPAFIPFRELGVLFDANVENTADMGFDASSFRVSLDVVPLSDSVLVPAAFLVAAGLRNSP